MLFTMVVKANKSKLQKVAGVVRSPRCVDKTLLISLLGNDYFDTSVLVGSGGNVTVQHWGNDSTRKGAPRYMQDAQTAWDKADQGTKNAIKHGVTLDGNGKVVYIGPTKEDAALRKFVRSFANGKTYIGIGAWGDDPGEPADNNLVCSFHTHGRRKIQAYA